MKIAITGAGGFLGTELLRQLAAMKDIKVYAFTFDFERNRETYIKSDNIVSVDNSEAENFDYSGTDVLINCAFPRNVSDETFAQGLDFIQKVIEKAVRDKVGSVINISSQSVYSQVRTLKADENSPAILETKYAVGKYCTELLINTVCRNIRHTNLRMASLIGVGFNQRITNQFAMKVIEGEKITVTGGNQLFGFLDVRDAVDGIIKVALSDCEWSEVYNLGTDTAYTLLEIAEEVVKTGREYGYNACSPIVEGEGKWHNSAIDCNRFFIKFNWKNSFVLHDTVSEIFMALKKGDK